MKFLLLAIVILSLACISCAKTDYADVLVTKVFDGDTLRLLNGEKVRLIGIDAPEMYESDKLYRDVQRTGRDIKSIQEMGREAYKFTKELVEGKKVMLEFDVEKRDKYGRLLAYVYIPTHKLRELKDYKDRSGLQLFLNAEIIKQGYAEVMIIPPNLKYADYFQGLYQEAKENKRGLWSN